MHIIRLANAAVDELRRRCTNTPPGTVAVRHDPLYDIRRLLVARHHLTVSVIERIETAWLGADPLPEVECAW